MSEALDRWKVFPREIERDLSFYHNVDIGDWLTGKVSSRKFLTFLDGLMLEEQSWYRYSVEEFIKELKDEEERLYKQSAHNIIFAQLMGQSMEVANGEN